MNILVMGLGQEMRGDDGAGLEAVRIWQQRYPVSARRVDVVLAGIPGLDLFTSLEGRDAAVLVDAIRDGSTPGTVLRLGPQDLSAFDNGARSAHGWGIAESVALGRQLNPAMANCRICLIGIIGVHFALGSGLSPAVNAALDAAAEMIEKEVQILLA